MERDELKADGSKAECGCLACTWRRVIRDSSVWVGVDYGSALGAAVPPTTFDRSLMPGLESEAKPEPEAKSEAKLWPQRLNKVAREMSPVEKKLRELGELQARSWNSIAALAGRLVPVLGPAGPCRDQDKPVVGISALHEQISCRVDEQRRMVLALEDLLARLTV
jgi:hypothetical protein